LIETLGYFVNLRQIQGANIPKGKPHLSNRVSREGKMELVLSKQNLIWITGFEGCNGGTEKLESQNV